MSDNYESTNFKFLGCISLENGHTAIGVIETLVTIAMIVNFFFAPWFSLAILVLFNLPFMVTYIKAQMLAS